MKNLFLTLITAMSISFLFGTFSKEDAVNLLLDDILKDDIHLIDVYVKADSICASDTLHLLNEDPISPPFSGNWVFFVDDMPGFHWHHPCRYIFVSTNDGTSQVYVESVCPFGQYSDFELVSQWLRPNPLYDPPNPPDPPTPNPVEYPENPHLWAVMISGIPLESDYEFWNSASQFYTMLIGWGFTEDHIMVNFNEGVGPNGLHALNSSDTNDYDVDSSAHRGSIEATFSYLESTLTPDDILVVYISGHGDNNINGETYYTIPPYDPMFDHELAALVNNINSASMFFLINFCFSGGFVDNLADISSASCLNRTIHTACSADELSAGEWWITLHRNDSISMFEEFPMYWSAAAQGAYPHFNDMGNVLKYFDPVPYEHLVGAYNTGSFPFECYSYDAWNNSFNNIIPADDDTFHLEFPDINPDAPETIHESWGNNDGILQLTEIFNYANYFDTHSIFGYFNPYRGDAGAKDRDATTNPINYSTQPDMMSYLTLRGMAGSVSDNDLHFATDFVVGDHLRLLDGSELTIEDNVHVKILDGASIVVQEGAILNIGENCVIDFDGSDPAIIVNGEINIAESVQFIKESLTSSTGLFLDSRDSVSMSNVSFENCSLRSENTGLSVVNSTFVNSFISQRSKSLNVSGCSFTNSNVNAYQAGTPPRTDQVTVYGSSFSDYNGCAIRVTGYPNYIIEHDTLSNVGNSRNSAIEISESGSGGLYSI
jgi:hypothetical protein